MPKPEEHKHSWVAGPLAEFWRCECGEVVTKEDVENFYRPEDRVFYANRYAMVQKIWERVQDAKETT